MHLLHYKGLASALLLVCGLALMPVSASAEQILLPALHYLSSPRLLYTDDFGDAKSGWPEAENEKIRIGYVDGEYEILVQEEISAIATPPEKAYSDFSFSADMILLSSDAEQDLGLALHFPDGAGSLYFVINEERKFIVWAQIYGNTELLEVWQEIPLAIYPPPDKNRLGIDYRAGNYIVYINGQEVARGTVDNIPPGDLGIGFLTSAKGSGFPAGARFDNLIVRELPD